MIGRFSTKTFFAVLAMLALLWVLLSWQLIDGETNDQAVNAGEADSETLVSAIQPISDANADSVTAGVASGRLNFRASSAQSDSLGEGDLVALKRRFDDANAAIQKGQLEDAITRLEAITTDFPSIVEPYLNLASLYAEQQQLEKARATLLKGFDANPKAGMLFDHLKQIHGALAANSYRQALDTKVTEPVQERLNLARASRIVTQLDQSNQIAALEKQLRDSQNQANASANESQTRKVAALELRLDEVRTAKLAERSTYEQELVGLKKQLAEQSQALSLSKIAEREALARVVRAEQDASTKIAEITKELESQKSLLVAAQSLSEQQAEALVKAQQQTQALALRDAQREAQSIRLAKEVAAQSASTEANKVNTAETENLAQQARERQAINLVQSWARAWSAQDVPAYVSHYADNFSSSRSITRSQWLEQRQVRLTNKEFINVNVSEFTVKDLGAQFSVTFSQYYQSNTVDDTVIKRLIFNKIGDDWSGSKIVNERLVSN